MYANLYGDPAAVPQVVTATTTDASAPTVWTATLPPSTTWNIWLSANGTKSDGSQGASYIRAATIRCSSAGVTAIVGGVQTPSADQADDGTWTAPAFSVTGQTVVLAAGGKSATSIRWKFHITITPGL